MTTKARKRAESQPLHSRDAERGVIGSVVIDPRRMDEVASIIRPSDFFDETHAIVWGHLAAMHAEGLPVDPTLLATRLGDKAGPIMAVVLEIASGTPAAAHAVHYARIVRDKSIQRAMLQATDAAVDAIYSADESPEEVITILRDAIEGVSERVRDSRGHAGGGTITIRQAMTEYLDTLTDPRDLAKLGLPGVDNALGGGVQPGEVIILAGRPSHGKTAAGLQAMDSLSKSMPVLIVSEEMSAKLLAQRLLCSLTFRKPEDWLRYRDVLRNEATSHLDERREILIAQSCGTVERAVSAIRHAKERHGIGAVMVDYLQLLRGSGISRYESVSDTSTRLKKAAVEHDLIILALCQLNRAVETRGSGIGGSCPKMSDLRDSGQIEQDADVLIFVEWPHRAMGDPTKQDPTEYRIRIAKNRNRPIRCGYIVCTFKADQQRLFPRDNREPDSGEPLPFPEFAAYHEDEQF